MERGASGVRPAFRLRRPRRVAAPHAAREVRRADGSRWLSTLDGIRRELVADSLVYRYNVEASPDAIQGEEGTFTMCSFWFVEALARAGQLDAAGSPFEKMLTYADHLSLYSGNRGRPASSWGTSLRRSRIALISAAFNLDRALG